MKDGNEDLNNENELELDRNLSSNKCSKISLNHPCCRICQTSGTNSRPLLSPCNCRGTLAFVHGPCLERWLNIASRSQCELCNFQFEARYVRRYTLLRSLAIWYKRPINRRYLKTDLFIAVLLTIITTGLILIGIIGYEYFIMVAKNYGMSQFWTKIALSIFLIIILIVYFGTMTFVIKDHAIPWYRWWTTTCNIQLIMHVANNNNNNLENGMEKQEETAEGRILS